MTKPIDLFSSPRKNFFSFLLKMASFSALYSLQEVPVERGRPSVECWEDTSHQPLMVGLTMSPVGQVKTNSRAGHNKEGKVASTKRRRIESAEFENN